MGNYFRRVVQKIFGGGGIYFHRRDLKHFWGIFFRELSFNCKNSIISSRKIFFHKSFPKPYLYLYLLCTWSFSLSIGKEESMSFAQFQKMKSQDWFSEINNAKKIPVPKVRFRVFHRLKNEIQNFIVRFCFCLNMKNEIQIFYYHFHV